MAQGRRYRCERTHLRATRTGFGALTPPPKFLGQHSKSNTPSPVSVHFTTLTPPLLPVPTASSLGKRSFFKKLSLRSERALPSPDSSQRPFDALVNFLPHNISDKSLLKQAILVTTISRPFLVAATPPSHSPPTRPSAPKRGSAPLFLRARRSSPVSCIYYHPARATRLPIAVLHSIESFLLSFSFPPALEIKSTDGLEPAQPVGTPPSLNINWTVADILLSGCLDDEPTRRAWLSGAADIIVASPPPMQHSPPIARRDPHTPASLDVNTRPNLGISALPTPPDSEEDMSSRHTLPTAKGSSHKHALGWKFWRRRMASDTSRRSRVHGHILHQRNTELVMKRSLTVDSVPEKAKVATVLRIQVQSQNIPGNPCFTAGFSEPNKDAKISEKSGFASSRFQGGLYIDDAGPEPKSHTTARVCRWIPTPSAIRGPFFSPPGVPPESGRESLPLTRVGARATATPTREISSLGIRWVLHVARRSVSRETIALIGGGARV
ncbi:hypothetical protein EDB89DRAFT_1902338 [Lactarius sanguifluus]|nr:hypothetical protein EDB89DRAFT_1902338 [Lactarius sanguifluus]